MPNWLGDCVMSLPILQGLKNLFPNGTIDIAIKNNLAGLGEILAYIDNTISPQNLKNRKYDTALILPNSFRSAYEIWQSNAPERIGYAGQLRSLLLTSAVKRPLRGTLHQSDYYGRLARKAFPQIELSPPALDIAQKYFDQLDELLPSSSDKPKIGVGFGATYGDAKMWPAERFAMLIDRLSEVAQVVLIGSDAEKEIEQRVLSEVTSKPISLVGRTNLPTLAAALSSFSVYLSNDTGPMHLASALGTPVVAIFGPTSPDETKPLGNNVTVIYRKAVCAPCWKRKCLLDHQCMTAITVDEVETAVLRILESKL